MNTPISYLFNRFHSEDQPLWNLSYYSDPAFDALVDQARRLSATDQAAASAPGLAIMLTALACAVLGDSLRDAADPTRRRR